MIGQETLLNRIFSMVGLGNFPSFSMIVGPKGSGKKELVKEIASYLKADIHKPDELKVDPIREMINSAQALNKPRIFLLSDADTMTVQAQNAILKFSEEPPKNAFVIMTLEDSFNVLTTIQSRAKRFKMEPYTKDQLNEFIGKEFTNDFMTLTSDLLLDIAENPGQIKHLVSINYEQMISTCETIVQNIGRISAANAFNILKHFHESQYELIIPMLVSMYGRQLKDMKNYVDAVETLDILKVLFEYKQTLKSKSINKVNALEMMFVAMRNATLEVVASEV